jgi:hypothetical protein
MSENNGLINFACSVCDHAIGMSAQRFRTADSVFCPGCGTLIDLGPASPTRRKVVKTTKTAPSRDARGAGSKNW